MLTKNELAELQSINLDDCIYQEKEERNEKEEKKEKKTIIKNIMVLCTYIMVTCIDISLIVIAVVLW